MTRKRKSLLKTRFTFKFSRVLRLWHRRLGIISSLFIILLVVTGVAINHSQALQLGRSLVQQSWLLDYYGISAPNHVAQFDHSSQPLWITDNQLWLGNQPILEASSRLISAVSLGEMLIAIDSNQLYLLDKKGNLQETQDTSVGLPPHLEALAVSTISGSSNSTNAVARAHEVWLKTESGYYRSDENLIDWTESQPLTPITWITPQKTVDHQLIQHARSANLNWERVILDLHSGRIFGGYSVWIWDALAFLLLLVSFSGLWIWCKAWRRDHEKK